MAEMSTLGWEVGGGVGVAATVVGVRGEEMLRECHDLLHGIILQAWCFDTWFWRSDPDRGYSVNDAYQLLTTQQPVTLGAAKYLIWHRQIPLKVSIFA
jgi:hypothetical protein